MLLIYPPMYVRRLSGEFSRVKLDSLEARLRSVEQLVKRTPWKAEGRTMQEQLSRNRDWVSNIMDDVSAAHTL